MAHGFTPCAELRPVFPPADVIEPPKPKVWPDAFGVDRTRVRLKQGQTEKLKGFFLPFTMTSHYATVVFKDKEQGEFVYEMVGEAGLPPPCMEQKVSAHARCMHAWRWVRAWQVLLR